MIVNPRVVITLIFGRLGQLGGGTRRIFHHHFCTARSALASATA
jgi:hypothetical protein